MSKIICDKQCTILWRDNDLNTSHVNPAVVYRILYDINVEYGIIVKMTITQGKVHKYLRINIDFYLPGNFILYMVDYIINMIYDT